MKEADTLVYAIGIYDRYFSTVEEQLGPALLSDISEETGGRMFTVDSLKDLVIAAARVSSELRNQYVLGYRPQDPKYDGKWHKIKVKMYTLPGITTVDCSREARLLRTVRVDISRVYPINRAIVRPSYYLRSVP